VNGALNIMRKHVAQACHGLLEHLNRFIKCSFKGLMSPVKFAIRDLIETVQWDAVSFHGGHHDGHNGHGDHSVGAGGVIPPSKKKMPRPLGRGVSHAVSGGKKDRMCWSISVSAAAFIYSLVVGART
jgi:hypothetical protein